MMDPQESLVIAAPVEVEIDVEDVIERWHHHHVRLALALRVRQEVRLPKQDDFCGWFQINNISQEWTNAAESKNSFSSMSVWSNVFIVPMQIKEVFDRYPFKVYAAQTELNFQSTVCTVGKLRPDLQVNLIPEKTFRWIELEERFLSGRTRLETLFLVEPKPTIEFLWRQGVSSSIRITLFLASPSSTRLARLVSPVFAIATTAAINVQKWNADIKTTALLLCATNLILPDLTSPRQRLKEGPNHDDLYICILFLGLAATALSSTAHIGLALLFASFTLPLASLLHYVNLLRRIRQKKHSIPPGYNQHLWFPCDHPKLRTYWHRYVHPITSEFCVGLGTTIGLSTSWNTLAVLTTQHLGDDPFLRLPNNDKTTYARRLRASSQTSKRTTLTGLDANDTSNLPFDDFDETGMSASASASSLLSQRRKHYHDDTNLPSEAAQVEAQRAPTLTSSFEAAGIAHPIAKGRNNKTSISLVNR